MKKIQKITAIYIIILLQCTLAISAGIFAVCLFSGSRLPAGIKAGNVDIGGLERKEAIKEIDKYYSDVIKSGKLKISVKDGRTYYIPYSDIAAQIDAGATIDKAQDIGLNSIETTLKKTYNTQKIILDPIISFNEGKLRKILISISSEIDKKPVNATLYYENGKIVRKVEQDGQKLDIAYAVDMIRRHSLADTSKGIVFSRYDNSALKTVQPELKLKDLADIDTIISEYSTKLIFPEFTDAIKLASKAVNGVILYPEYDKESQVSEFSLVDWLTKSDIGFENDNEGYDQVASTLYAAILSAGIDKSAITRLAHNIPVEYIEPGLDAWISVDGGELKFSNTLSHKLAIFANIEDDRFIIRIAGNYADKKSAELKTEVTEHIAPSVINIENGELKTGEKVVLDQGKEGMKIKLYRNDELISEDKYDAISKVVQIGPGTDWSGSDEGK